MKISTAMFFSLLLPLLALGAPPPAKETALELKADLAGAKVTFLAVGKPSMLKIHGTAATGPAGQLKVEGNQLQGSIEMDMDKLDTGIDLRTEHMKEKYLEVKEYPKSTLILIEAPVDEGFASTLTNKGEKPFKGKLKLHGKEQEVTGTFTVVDGNVAAKFPVKLSDFAVEIPSYLGIKVADVVNVDVILPLKK